MDKPIDRSDGAYDGPDEPGSANPYAGEGRISDAKPRARVIVVNTNPVMRGVARLACEASRNIEVISEAGDAETAVDLCRRLRPDVLVLDLPLSDADGFDVVRLVKQDGGGPKVVVTGADDADTIYRSRVLGVEGYVDRASLAQNIATIIEQVADGNTVYTSDHDRRALERLAYVVKRARVRHRILATLTPREQEILPLLAQGLSNQQCARQLGISIRTLESHIGRIYRKLEARSRMEAVGKAVSLGLLGEGDPKTGQAPRLEPRA